jgi:hypothetical protein
MAASIFDNKLQQPESEALKQALGETYVFWQEITRHIEENWGTFVEEWRYYNQRSGWLLKILLKKRNLFFFVPKAGGFHISYIFGDKAVAAIEAGDLPEDIKERLCNAKKYMEGRGVNVEVKTEGDVDHVKKLLAVKMQS